MPDPRRIPWNPAFWKCYDLRPSLGCLFDDVAGLLNSFGKIEPCRLMLRYCNANGVGSACHGFEGAEYETNCVERSREIDRNRQPISYDPTAEIGRRSSRGV